MKEARKKVLFVCTHNSARSQMAEGLLNSLYGDRYQACSAGTEPSVLNLYAIQVMAEIGIDISKNRSKSINEFMKEKFDYVITVCDHANETCPFFPGGMKRLHRGFEDPASFKGIEADTLSVFRRIRNEIKEWIKKQFGPDS
ncbi:MAG: arsenate reductase ArsC [Candidatus Aminicenantes bacterium]|nr:MAG: arsenate reductase ArsC [Candidatus Aminicenantes bacterium]